MRSGSRRSAEAVLPRLLELAPARSLVDVGCGWRSWMRAALDLGVGEVVGFDGEWVDPEKLEVPAAAFRRADLATPLELDERYDVAISLEVAEHLPESAAAGIVAALAGAAPVVAFSAAIPGQGGYGHVNEQWLAYWAEHFARHGFEPVDALRPLLWDDPDVEWWYAQNVVLYASAEGLRRHPALAAHPQRARAPLSLVHPRRRPARRALLPRGARRHGRHRVPRQQRRPVRDRRLRALAGGAPARGVPAARLGRRRPGGRRRPAALALGAARAGALSTLRRWTPRS
jgi:hypothetical protein